MNIKANLQYARYIVRHKLFVLIECIRFGIPFAGIIHDWQKMLPVEWIPYRDTFYGPYEYGKRPQELVDAFNRAWLHHIHYGAHHWNHYLLREDNPIGTKFLGDIPISDIATEINKFRHVHLSLSPIAVDSYPLQVIQIMRSSFTLGDDVIDTGINTWDQFLSGDSASVVLFFQEIKQGASKGSIFMSAAIPDHNSPMQQAETGAIGHEGSRTTDTANTLLSLSDAFFQVFTGCNFSPLPSAWGSEYPSLASTLMQATESSNLAAAQFSRLSVRQAHMIGFALDAVVTASQFSSKNLGAIAIVPIGDDFHLMWLPRSSTSFSHIILSKPRLLKCLSSLGKYTTNENGVKSHHWQHWLLHLDTGEMIALEMPEKYRTEMLADWIGAGRALGRFDPKDRLQATRNWYTANRSNITLHANTRSWVEQQLSVNTQEITDNEQQ